MVRCNSDQISYYWGYFETASRKSVKEKWIMGPFCRCVQDCSESLKDSCKWKLSALFSTKRMSQISN